jgi:Zn-dependent membrane protease YugP
VLTGGELEGAKKVLTAAALTYLAALLVTFLQFLSLSMLSRRR